MNSKRGPQQKLNSIIQCSKVLFEALKESIGHPAGADEFLPALIYVILKSNPPLLQSNINFITRFAVPPKADRGQSGYYFSSLVSNYNECVKKTFKKHITELQKNKMCHVSSIF